MHSTHLRKEHIHGLLLGTAIGETLGLPRSGLSRRAVLRRFGCKLKYSWLPGANVYGDYTRLMLLNAQALLNSRSELDYFRRAFRWRLGWYILGLPAGIHATTLRAGLRAWLRPFKISSGVDRADAGAATRALCCTLAINGCGHRLSRWIEISTSLTHTNSQALASCQALAALIDYGVSTREEEFQSQAALQQALTQCFDPELKSQLEKLEQFIEAGPSGRVVARRLGWHDGIEGLVPITTMAIYCWLRYRGNFTRALRSSLTLGGDSETLGAIVGGLAGASLGQAGIPDALQAGLGGWPHGPEWIDLAAKRFSHWPHGVDDLHAARAQSSDPLLQIVRNLGQLPARTWYATRRMLCGTRIRNAGPEQQPPTPAS